MKLKLIDMKTEDAYEVQTGTCELCFGTTIASDPVFVFEKDGGERFEIDGYYWDWGDYQELLIDNVIAFAAFVAERDFDAYQNFGYGWLEDLVDKYYEQKEEPA